MGLPLLRGLALEELQQVCEQLGLPRFRAGQVFEWVQAKAVGSWEEMKNVPAAVRHSLAQAVDFHVPQVLREQVSGLDLTRKYLFRLPDGQTVESVLMRYERAASRDRATVCVSTQVGCAMNCAFCATGLSGLVRDLEAGEIVGQVLDIQRLLSREDQEFSVTNVVFMGMGEPLQNYANVLRAMDLLSNPHGQNIGMRRITVSTCGIVPGILDLARDNPQVTLAISLHAARDELRNTLVRVNKRYSLQELISACRKYIDITNKRITFEYALIKGVNSSSTDAADLVRLLKGLLCNVNLIPVNPVAETGLERPSKEEIQEFTDILTAAGIEVSLREEKGTDIDAACGQLRKRQGGGTNDVAGQI